jgi:oxygen-independent coproporphyrinogen III oxidase
MLQSDLFSKYNVQVPRYTSYPTVPFWKELTSEDLWIMQLQYALQQKKMEDGISVYLHLPFCESLCTYCGCNKRITKNHAVEDTYIAAILKEWGKYTDLLGSSIQVRELHLGGGTPTFFSASNLDLLISGLFITAKKHPMFEGSFEGHPNNTSKAHLATLYQHGFRRVSFGVQDMDLKVQTAIHRIQPYENVVQACSNAREIGFNSVNFDLIYGLPFQTLNSIRKTFESVIRLLPERIAFYSYAHVPWTSKAQRAYDENDLPKGPEKRALYDLGHQLLTQAGYEDVGMDHFSLPGDQLLAAKKDGSLHRNFMGYTTAPSKVLIGLGVSAISDAFYAYRQNEKKLEDYYRRLKMDELPIAKGIDLTSIDIEARTHILDITCRLETSLPTPGSMLRTEEMDHYLEQLSDDGLIIREGDGLRVTPSGSSFLRNVAAAFDPYYLSSMGSHHQMFSQAV